MAIAGSPLESRSRRRGGGLVRLGASDPLSIHPSPVPTWNAKGCPCLVREQPPTRAHGRHKREMETRESRGGRRQAPAGGMLRSVLTVQCANQAAPRARDGNPLCDGYLYHTRVGMSRRWVPTRRSRAPWTARTRRSSMSSAGYDYPSRARFAGAHSSAAVHARWAVKRPSRSAISSQGGLWPLRLRRG
jgi:hypothetical protein